MKTEEQKERNRIRAKAYYYAHHDLMRARRQAQYKANPEKNKMANKFWREQNPDKARESLKHWKEANPNYMQEWREKNPDKAGRWGREHPEEVNIIKKRWMDNNPEKRREVTAKYREANREKSRAYNRAYMARKRRDDPEGEKAKMKAWRKGNLNYKIAKVLRGRVSDAIKRALGPNGKKCDHTMALIGCSVEEVIAHLERQFQPGMTWDNRGNKGVAWVIDHIRPCASFDLSDPDQQRQCFHWTNLQPLWWWKNLEKGDKRNPTQAA